MAKIRFAIGAANEPDVTKRVLTFTGKESAPVAVEFDGPGASTQTTGDLTGAYAVGDQITDGSLVQSNPNGDGPAVAVPALSLVNGNVPQPADASTLTAALVS